MNRKNEYSKLIHIEICSNCSKEVEPHREFRSIVKNCPECGKRMIYTDDKCYAVAKLLKEINLKPISTVSHWSKHKDGKGSIKIFIRLDMLLNEAMFSELPNYKFCNKNSTDIDGFYGIDKDVSALSCEIRNITNEFVSVKYLSSSDVQQILDSRIKELKDWCEDYKANYEARWAVGKIAGWLD